MTSETIAEHGGRFLSQVKDEPWAAAKPGTLPVRKEPTEDEIK